MTQISIKISGIIPNCPTLQSFIMIGVETISNKLHMIQVQTEPQTESTYDNRGYPGQAILYVDQGAFDQIKNWPIGESHPHTLTYSDVVVDGKFLVIQYSESSQVVCFQGCGYVVPAALSARNDGGSVTTIATRLSARPS